MGGSGGTSRSLGVLQAEATKTQRRTGVWGVRGMNESSVAGVWPVEERMGLERWVGVTLLKTVAFTHLHN